MTQPQPHLTIESMCRLAGVSRAGFYRRFLKREPRTEEVELRAEMQRIVLAHRHRYGYRRVTAALRAEGWAVNRKRVARLMRDDNLLALSRRSFVATSDSGHNLPVAMNLAGKDLNHYAPRSSCSTFLILRGTDSRPGAHYDPRRRTFNFVAMS